MSNTYFHSGCIGDVIYSLPTVCKSGTGDYFIGDRPWTKPIEKRFDLFAPLLRKQPYINSIQIHKKEKITHDFSTFRNGGLPYGVTLAELQAKWVGAAPDFSEPWLEVEPDKEMAGRIIINRTGRYQNSYFPWTQLVETFRKEMVFVGTREEHIQFSKQFGEVFYLPTKSLLEVAQAIAGAELFIGNQSSPNAVCEGLKAPLVQEVCITIPDCIFPRDNAIHCFDGSMDFEACGKKFQSGRMAPRPFLDLQVTPPGGWRVSYDGCSAKTYDFPSALLQIKTDLMAKGKEVPSNLKEIIVAQLQDSLPPPPELRPIQMVRELIATKRF